MKEKTIVKRNKMDKDPRESHKVGIMKINIKGKSVFFLDQVDND